MMNTL